MPLLIRPFLLTVALLLSPVLVSAQASLTISSTAVQPGGSLTVTVSNGPGSIYDWITISPVGSPDNAYQGIWFLNGTGIPPAVPLTSASFSITAPATVGLYEVRFLASGYYGRLATSEPVTVSGSPTPLNPQRIVFHGDSNSSHAYTSGSANWTMIAGSGLGYADIQNLAIPGAYSDQVKIDLQQIIGLHPDLAVVMVGTNDMASAVQQGIPHAERLGSYLRTMQTVIETLRGAGIRTVILSPIFTLNAQETTRFPDWVDGLRTLCVLQQVQFLDVWSHMASLSEQQTKAQFESYFRVPEVDPWHLSDAGHAMIAAFVLSKIQR